MRKDICLPALAVGGGAAGFVLRKWQLATAYQPEEGLFINGAAATLALLALTALAAAAILLLGRGLKKGPEDFLPAFGCPEAGQMALLAAAGLLMLAAGALCLRDGVVRLQLWRSIQTSPLASPASLILTGVLALPAGLGLLLLGRMAYRGEMDDTACLLAPFPAAAGLVWLFATHLRHGTEPVLMRYGFGLAAAGLLTLAHFYAAGYLYGKCHPRRTVFCALAGVLFGLISLADGPDLATAALTIAFSLSALGWARVLLRNSFGPPWPERPEGRMPGRAEDEDEEET